MCQLPTAADNVSLQEDLEKLKGELTKYVKAWKKRKRIVMDVVGRLSEGSGQKPKQIMV